MTGKVHIVRSTHSKANDYYPTPPTGTFALTKASAVPRSTWEPCAGRGWISRTLRRLGHDVVSSDLYPYPDPLVPDIDVGVDMLTADLPAGVEACVTNPPFKKHIPERFIRHCMGELGVKYAAMFLRMSFGESMGRYPLFTEEYTPSHVLMFSGRMNNDETKFETPAEVSGMIFNTWFVWDYREAVPKHGDTRVKWIDTQAMYDELYAGANLSAFIS